MLGCTRHLSAVCAVWSALTTQFTVNLEHSNALSTQCTRSNGHSALSATHLTGTACSVRASCVVARAREPRRPPWVSLSLSLPLTRALPRSSRLRLSLRRPKVYRNLRARTGISCSTVQNSKKKIRSKQSKNPRAPAAHCGDSGIHSDAQICRVGPAVSWPGSRLVVRRRADGFSHYH